jgi:hypothetical protein
MRSAFVKAVLVAVAIATVPTLSIAQDFSPPWERGPGPSLAAPPLGPPVPAIVTGEGNQKMEYLPVDENTIIIPHASPTQPAPNAIYGCKRIWRCDSVVCDWRRGCWGVYGYMEGPYYNVDLAKRQWERHGWPTGATSTTVKRRVTVTPALK